MEAWDNQVSFRSLVEEDELITSKLSPEEIAIVSTTITTLKM